MGLRDLKIGSPNLKHGAAEGIVMQALSAPPAERVTSQVARGQRGKRWLGLLVLAALVAVAVLLSVAYGANSLTLGQVWHGLWSPNGTEGDIVVRRLRLPRTALALVAGLALGVAGALMQGHTRNPIADPVVLGVSAGAGMCVVASISLLGIGGLYGYIWFGFVGAAVASAIVYLVGTLARGGATPITLALAGAAVHALFTALTAGMVIMDRAALDTYRFWTVGSVSGRPIETTVQLLPFIAIGLLLAAANAPGLNALSLGEDVARSLGVRIGATRATGMAAITLLTGAAVAVCGPIGFVGLVATHVARHFTGPDYRWIVAYSGLLGAALMVAADTLGRLVARPGELEVGIMLALLGGPVFVYLVRRVKPVRL